MKNFLKTLFSRLGAKLRACAARVGAWLRRAITATFTLLDRLGKDKYQHFAVGAVLAAGAFVVGLWCGVAAWCALIFSAAITTGAAVAKERWVDEQPDREDLIATLTGGVVVWIVALAAYIAFGNMEGL